MRFEKRSYSRGLRSVGGGCGREGACCAWMRRAGGGAGGAGEALRRELAEAVLALPQGPELWNLYGSSEDTTYSTGARIERGTEAPPIGRPLPNSRAYVLDGY